MLYFFSDLDNTLIHSRRHRLNGPALWVEALEGRPQSAMLEADYRYFREQNWLRVVPVTTRNARQYGRLGALAEALGWDTALICNGAVLLKNGREDEDWTRESLALAEGDLPACALTARRMADLAEPAGVVFVEPFFYYCVTDEAEKVYNGLLPGADPARIAIYRTGRKVYTLPKALSKGKAVERYVRRFGDLPRIAAGDSASDLSMLEEADFRLYPEELAPLLTEAEGKTDIRADFRKGIGPELEKIRAQVM